MLGKQEEGRECVPCPDEFHTCLNASWGTHCRGDNKPLGCHLDWKESRLKGHRLAKPSPLEVPHGQGQLCVYMSRWLLPQGFQHHRRHRRVAPWRVVAHGTCCLRIGGTCEKCVGDCEECLSGGECVMCQTPGKAVVLLRRVCRGPGTASSSRTSPASPPVPQVACGVKAGPLRPGFYAKAGKDGRNGTCELCALGASCTAGKDGRPRACLEMPVSNRWVRSRWRASSAAATNMGS